MSDHLQARAIVGFDSLDGAARAAALKHLEGCAACRQAWLARDPVRGFALLSRAEIPEQRLDELSVRVSGAIEGFETAPAQRGKWFGAAAIAASMFLAALVGAVLWTHEIPEDTLVRIDEIGVLQPLEGELAGMRLIDTGGSDAQFFDLKIGDTQVLMIFDESIEL